MDNGMKTRLSREEAVEQLRVEWARRRQPVAKIGAMQQFLPQFYARVTEKFWLEDEATYFRNLFIVSKSQACLRQDLLDGNVPVQIEDRTTVEFEGGRDFDVVCDIFYNTMAKKSGWFPFNVMEDMYAKLQRKNPEFNQDFQLISVLERMAVEDVLKLKHKKLRKIKKPKRIGKLYEEFTEHIRQLKDEKPSNRTAMKNEFEKKFPESQDADFVMLVSRMKQKKLIKFSSGEANITYLKPMRITTDQHYFKRMDPKVPAHNPQFGSGKQVFGKANTLQSKRGQLTADRNGIYITSDQDTKGDACSGILNFGAVMPGDKYMIKITIQYVARGDACQQMELTGCQLLDNFDNLFTIGDKHNIHQGKKTFTFESRSTYQLTVYYKSQSVGKHACPLAMTFKNPDIPNGFQIYRFLHAETKTAEMTELMPSKAYVPLEPRQINQDPSVETVPGVPPESLSTMQVSVQLGPYRIPSNVRFDVNSGEGKISNKLRDMLEDNSSLDAYRQKFHSLLYLEELQMEVDIRRYDMHDVPMRKLPALMSLHVPGLAEGRPSVVIGDRVYARIQAADKGMRSKKEFEGFVHAVELDRVLLKFHSSFHSNFVTGQLHAIRFIFNRFTIRLQHRAIDIACELVEKNSFPSINLTWLMKMNPALLPEIAIRNIRVFDRKIESNQEQLTAIKNIVQGTSRPYPYIIFGPPGTGKTVTAVEAMRQVLKLLPNSRILACAPSNSAADLILHRLLHPCPIPTNKLFRLNAITRSMITLPKEYDIKAFCKIRNSVFDIPTVEELQNYRVIVTTMTTAGRLVSMGLDMNHFTHVFMDECGQAIEPEALIPLAGLISPENPSGGQIVMAGDPKQLGPVLQSPIAGEHGLQQSLLERLMRQGPIYQRGFNSNNSDDGLDSDSDCDSSDLDDIINEALNDDKSEPEAYNQKYITKLVQNYRSHPVILKKPNELFYDDELVPKADMFKVTTLCQWDVLPAKDFPVIFHGVLGEDLREDNSPSFFNPYEAVEVVNYVNLLLDARNLGVSVEEIGIISPYRKQVSKIRSLLRKDKSKRNVEEIKVGSVEEFQGQERRVIIISTVRSNSDYLKNDSAHRLGFLRNPKRFNVAITRAQALLIIVGNPFVLATDYYWKELLEYCIQNKGYKGCKYEEEVVKSLATSANLLKDMADQFSNLMSKDTV